MELLEQGDCVVYHVCLFGELILGGLHLFYGEEIALGKMSKEGKDEVAVAVGDDRFCEIVLCHFEVLARRWEQSICSNIKTY